MASVGSVSGSSSAFYNNKISGLASGMDTESMIENMTAATRAKIAKQKQSKQTLQWKMDAMRSVSDLLVSFKNKFASFASPSTNLLNSSFFSRSLINCIGENSKYIKATGTSNSADSMSILGVKQLATSTTMNVSGASDKVMESGELDLSDTAKSSVSSISGRSMSVKYGDKIYNIAFDSNREFSTMQDVADAINEQLDENEIKVNASVNDKGALVFEADKRYEGNTFEIKSGTNGILDTLGIKAESKLSGKGSQIVGNNYKTGDTADKDRRLTETKSTWEILSGKSISFSYNGTTKQISMPTKDELESYKKENKIDDNFDALQKMTQEKLDKAFGKGRITVGNKLADADGKHEANKGQLTFTTTTPKGDPDTTSVLKITSAGAGLLGKAGILGMDYGESNRINTNAALKDSGLTGQSGLVAKDIKIAKLDKDGNQVKDANGNTVYEYEGKGYEFTINGEKFQFKESDSLSTVMNTINKSDAGVTMSYNETSDSFTIKASDSGAAGEIEIEDGSGSNLAATLFGVKKTDANGEAVKDEKGNVIYERKIKGENGKETVLTSALKEGKDAIISVDFGDGSEPIEISRSSNVFDLNGLSVTVSGTFGTYDGDHIDVNASKPEDSVTFEAKVDSDKAVDAVKQMVEDYNSMIELVNKELTTKRDRNYAPLTDEQKKEMSEDEIKLWEEKAKAGMLFNDADLRALANELRTVFSGTDIKALQEAGITLSSEYSENGKITFDEEKFRAAVEADPDAISKLFTSEKDENGGGFNGIITSMNNICEKYAATTGATKGILIERAGNKSAPLSLLNNSYFKQMNSIDEIIDSLNDKLKSERERYNKQFTNLETLIAQMNSQSSWLTQQFGGQ